MSERPVHHSAGDVSAVAVVVPAQDEELLLPRCLTALEAAVSSLRQARPTVRVEIVVVLDACTDGTAAVAARHAVHVTTISSRCVGVARGAGAAAAPPKTAGDAAAVESLWRAANSGTSASIIPKLAK